jgi:hypothetical protein
MPILSPVVSRLYTFVVYLAYSISANNSHSDPLSMSPTALEGLCHDQFESVVSPAAHILGQLAEYGPSLPGEAIYLLTLIQEITFLYL